MLTMVFRSTYDLAVGDDYFPDESFPAKSVTLSSKVIAIAERFFI